jgi:hypothetical protein
MTTTKPPDAAVQRREQAALAVAADQRMLIARSQAIQAGLTPRQIRHRVATGRWLAVHSRTYAVDGRPPRTWEAQLQAVLLEIPGSVAAGRTALRIHGAQVDEEEDEDRFEVSAPMGTRTTIPGVLLRQHRRLDGQGTVVDGLPVTTLQRTVVDLAGELDLAGRLRLLEDAIDAGMSRRAFVALAQRESRGRAGLRFLHELARDAGRDRFRSWLEGEAARCWERAGLPTPRFNVVLRDGSGRIGEVDAVFPGGVVTAELDGLRFHMTAAQRRRDKAKDRRLQLSERVVLRFDYQDVVRRPEQMVAQLREALDSTSGRAIDDRGERVR